MPKLVRTTKCKSIDAASMQKIIADHFTSQGELCTPNGVLILVNSGTSEVSARIFYSSVDVEPEEAKN